MVHYQDGLKRVLGVIDTALENEQWLGDKSTFADLSFVPWNDRIDMLLMRKPEDKFHGFKT